MAHIHQFNGDVHSLSYTRRQLPGIELKMRNICAGETDRSITRAGMCWHVWLVECRGWVSALAVNPVYVDKTHDLRDPAPLIYDPVSRIQL
jgi:hypothetical protein